MNKGNIFIIGCGNMGSSIITGLIDKGFNRSSITGIDIDHKKIEDLKKKYGINTSEDPSIIKDGGLVLLAVKPGYIEDLLNSIKSVLTPGRHTVVSIAAGIKIDTIEKVIGSDIPVARCMPNLNAQVGRAITAIAFNNAMDDPGRNQVKEVMGSIGDTIVIEENLFDAVTGLSGSGPAYVFLFIEALADGGVLMGIPREKALKLAVDTVLGSAEFIKKKNIPPSIAREMVSSPGGTTVEGLFALEEGKFRYSVIKAVKMAAEKSAIIGKNPQNKPSK